MKPKHTNFIRLYALTFHSQSHIALCPNFLRWSNITTLSLFKSDNSSTA